MGLSVSDLFSGLVADQLYAGTKQGLVDMLAGNPDTYVKGFGGRWLDAALVAADGGAAGANELEAVDTRRSPVAAEEIINGKALPMIDVTDKGVAALENGDTRALPSRGS